MPQGTVLGISHLNNLLQEQRDDVISMENILDRVPDSDPNGSALIELLDPIPDPHLKIGSGSGYRRKKMTPKNRKR
jgi:hypothetical protein